MSDERELHLGNGTIVELEDGEEISTASPGRPNDAIAPFWEAIVREIGMSVGLPYEVLIKHFQASYSASHAAFLIAWKYFFGKRGWLGGGFCQMAYEWTISEAIARELLPAPGFFENPLVRRAYLDAADVSAIVAKAAKTKDWSPKTQNHYLRGSVGLRRNSAEVDRTRAQPGGRPQA